MSDYVLVSHVFSQSSYAGLGLGGYQIKLSANWFRSNKEKIFQDNNPAPHQVAAKLGSLTQPGDQRLKDDFRTTNGRADGLLARTGSAVTHPSSSHARRGLTRSTTNS
ncbi:hypothetical protein J6590_081139 [Homalodisca vitripennis]|nr:hypothetical protein J6590_081139 [Homalodisca vitripennis]